MLMIKAVLLVLTIIVALLIMYMEYIGDKTDDLDEEYEKYLSESAYDPIREENDDEVSQ